MGHNVRVLTAADADTNPNHRYGFGGRGFVFIGESRLVVGQPAQVWALYKKDGLSSLPAGGLYGANADHSNLANVPQGSAYLFILRTTATALPPTYTPPPPPPTEPEEPEAPEFDDVDEGSVHAESITTVAELEIMTGTTVATFSPSVTVTRAEMATFLERTWRASGRECTSSEPAQFDDVAADSVHAASINCMSALGIVRGTAAGVFLPSQTVTRAQMAAFLARFYQAFTVV